MSASAVFALEPVALVPPRNPAVISRAYFGMHIHRALVPGHWPAVPFGAWRLWDADVSWADVQPVKGGFNFALLDGYVAKAQGAGVELLLPLGRTPRWAAARPDEFSPYGPGQASEPANIEDWRNYVRSVVTRYRGQIAAYEIWNEVTEKAFWTGTTDKLLELTRVAAEEIRRIDPAAQIVAPAGTGVDARTGWARKFLDAGGAQWVNVTSHHLYHGAHAPELTIPTLLKMQNELVAGGYRDMPIWNTESGYFTETADPSVKWSADEVTYRLPVEDVAANVVRDLLLARVLGFERFFWYAWDNEKLGLFDEKRRQIRLPGIVYGNAAAYLTRSVLQRCDMDASGAWACQLTLANGRAARVLWKDSRAASSQLTVRAPFAGNLKSFESPDQQIVSAGESITLSASPLLLTQANPQTE